MIIWFIMFMVPGLAIWCIVAYDIIEWVQGLGMVDGRWYLVIGIWFRSFVNGTWYVVYSMLHCKWYVDPSPNTQQP